MARKTTKDQSEQYNPVSENSIEYIKAPEDPNREENKKFVARLYEESYGKERKRKRRKTR